MKETMMIQPYGFIYQVTNLVNGKKYIGQTINRKETRWYGSLKTIIQTYTCNTHLKHSIKKYGIDNFEVETIDRAMTKEELDHKEDYYIRKYNTINPKFGYNQKYGGSNGKHTEASKKKMSENHKDNSGEKNPMFGKIPWNKGKHLNDKIIEKISNSQKKRFKENPHLQDGKKNPMYGKTSPMRGRKRSKETKKRIKENHANVSGKNNPMYGKHHSKETKQKISDSLKGKTKGINNPNYRHGKYCKS